MRTLKKTLSLVLVLAMMLSFGAIGGTAAFGDQDAIDPEYAEAIEVMNALGIIRGDDNDGDGVNDFRPGDTLTRAEAARIIVAVLKAEPLANLAACTFGDVPADHWAYKWIGYLQALGIMKGYGDGNVGPDDELTGAQFVLMLMKAMGVDVSSVNPETYELDTITLAVKLGLGTAEELAAKPFTRQLAAAAGFEGLMYDPDASTGYAILNSSGTVIGYADSILEAAIAAGQIGGGATYSTTPTPLASGSLGVTQFGLEFVTSVDSYGRPVNKWTVGGETIVEAASSDATIVYTDKVNAATVAANLKGYSVVADNNSVYKLTDDTNSISLKILVEDGKTETAGPMTGSQVAAWIAGLTSNSTAVEIYANSKNVIEKVVVINTYAATIAKVTEANEDKDIPASVTLGNTSNVNTVVETTGFEKGDVVIYNKTYNSETGNYDVSAIALADSVTGTLEKYTKDGVLTIDGAEYEISDLAIAGTYNDMTTEYIWYLNEYGNIVHLAPAEEVEVVALTYGYVTKIAYENEGSLLNATSYAAQAEVLLTDGSIKVYNVKVTAGTGANAGKYFVGDIELTGPGTTVTVDKPYSYTIDDNNVMTLKALTTAKQTTGAIDMGDTGAEGVVIDVNTVFVLEKDLTNSKDDFTAVKGTAALGTTTVAAGAWIVYEQVGTSYIAVAVFAPDTQYVAPAVAPDTDAYVYVDGVYEVTYDAAAKAYVYTYTGVKADGTEIELTGKADRTAGIYQYVGDELYTDAPIAGTGKVTAAVGSTWTVGAYTFNVTADTEVCELTAEAVLAVGAEVAVIDINNDGIADIVFVVKAAE